MIFWTPSDIAWKLGRRRTSVVNNWHNRGALPEPTAYTSRGTPLWTDEQAQEILKERQEHIDRMIEQAKSSEHINAVLQGMIARGVKFPD